jgi:hypothetical protein
VRLTTDMGGLRAATDRRGGICVCVCVCVCARVWNGAVGAVVGWWRWATKKTKPGQVRAPLRVNRRKERQKVSRQRGKINGRGVAIGLLWRSRFTSFVLTCLAERPSMTRDCTCSRNASLRTKRLPDLATILAYLSTSLSLRLS